MDNFLIMGAKGDLGGTKLMPTYREFAKKGTALYAADIVPRSEFKPKFNGFTEYFDLSSGPDRDALRKLGQSKPFDLIYEATWPDAHILDVLDWQSIANQIIVTKPFVSIEHYQTLRSLMVIPGYRSIVGKMMQHDHYINKPALEEVITHLPQAHSTYGKFAHMTIVITERRTVNDQRHRLRALTGGMIPDLDSHAVMIIQRLVPTNLVWEDGEGNHMKRFSRDIKPVACIRAQMKNAKCNQDVDTACIVEYRVTESLNLIDEKGAVGEPVENTFYVLVVCAKGLQAEGNSERDLKAIEIAFQGQGQSTGVIDLETNAVNEIFRAIPEISPCDDEIRKHKGINRPMFAAIDTWPKFVADELLRDRLFQSPALIWENMRLLWETMTIAKKGILPAYGSRDLIHNFVNSHIGPANGFRYFGQEGSGWPAKEPPLHLMRGRVTEDMIA